MTEIIAAVIGACVAAGWSWFLQNSLVVKQEKFQKKLLEEQLVFQRNLSDSQNSYQTKTMEENREFCMKWLRSFQSFLDTQAMERRNFEKTGIHSMTKIGGG